MIKRLNVFLPIFVYIVNEIWIKITIYLSVCAHTQKPDILFSKENREEETQKKTCTTSLKVYYKTTITKKLQEILLWLSSNEPN